MDVSYTVFDGGRIDEATLLGVYPFYPVYPGEQNLGLVEDRYELLFVVCERPYGFVSVECGLPRLPVYAAQAAGESGNVGGDTLDSHRAEIDDAGYVITDEENVIVPNIAEARLQFDLDGSRRLKGLLQFGQPRLENRQNVESSLSQTSIDICAPQNSETQITQVASDKALNAV